MIVVERGGANKGGENAGSPYERRSAGCACTTKMPRPGWA